MTEREALAREEAIFHAALERPPEEREAYIELTCAADKALRDRVMRLVQADSEATESPVAPIVDLVTRSMGKQAPDVENLAGQRIGAYRLVRQIGEGGMGSVWLAERDDQEFERVVAIKLIKRGMDSEQVLRRFRIERRALGVLEHPSIARLIDAAIAPDGRPALVMEYVDGLPLTEFCESNRLGVTQRIELFLKVCDAVEYAHQRLVIHRDLKPSNIVVTPEGEPKLIDFGIAKLLSPDDEDEQTITRTHQRVLTPRYASPEQIRGDRVTTATDVFSLGVVLYELLTGRPPFDSPSGSRDEIGRLICEQNPVRPSTAVTQAPSASASPGDATHRPIDPARLRRVLEGDLDMIVLMALRKEPERRYSSVAELAEDLRRHQADLPVRARPDTVGYRTAKFVRRNRGAVVSASAVIGVMIVAIGALSWMYTRTRTAEKAELEQRLAAEAKLVEADRVATFLEEMLESATPDRAEGKNPEVLREILDTAERRLDTELADQPGVRARIEHTLGTSYRLVGDYEKAERHLEQAEKIRRSLPEAGGARLGETLYERAALEMDRSQIDAAERYASEALEIFKRHDSEPTRRLANTEDLLACVELERGRFDEARLAFEKTIKRYEAILSPDAPELLGSYGKLAIANAQLGQIDTAVGMLRQALSRFEQAGGEISTQTIALKNNLAVLLRRSGLLDEAKTIYDQVVADADTHFGQGHRITLLARANRATVLHRLGRLDEAEHEFVDVLTKQQALLGPSHDNTLTTAFNYAQLLSDIGRFSDAEPLYLDVIARSEAHLGKLHPQTAQLKGAYARAILAHQPERIDEAQGLLSEQLDTLCQTLGEEHPATLRARRSLDELGPTSDMAKTDSPSSDAGSP